MKIISDRFDLFSLLNRHESEIRPEHQCKHEQSSDQSEVPVLIVRKSGLGAFQAAADNRENERNPLNF